MIGKTIQCNSCGANLDMPEGINKIFCLYCGTVNILTGILEIPGAGLICLVCKNINKDDSIYCRKCGAELQMECPFCTGSHPKDTIYCSKTGNSIKDFKTNIETAKKELSHKLKENMVLIENGSFFMGQKNIAEPVHKVTLKSFYIQKFPVTNKEYFLFLNSMGNEIEDKVSWMEMSDDSHCGIIGGTKAGSFICKPGYENHPAVYVSWFGAVSYCNWLSEEHGLEKCYGEKDKRGNVDINKNGYRLPSETEWEYACRGGSNTDYYWGNEMDDSCCWYVGNSNASLQPVGQKTPNKWGLYDMSGNIWEWCSDWHDDNYHGHSLTNDAGGPPSGQYRVLRGGSWYHEKELCRSAHRNSLSPDFRYCGIGFRLARNEDNMQFV